VLPNGSALIFMPRRSFAQTVIEQMENKMDTLLQSVPFSLQKKRCSFAKASLLLATAPTPEAGVAAVLPASKHKISKQPDAKTPGCFFTQNRQQYSF
jgi:hypothetical protein